MIVRLISLREYAYPLSYPQAVALIPTRAAPI